MPYQSFALSVLIRSLSSLSMVLPIRFTLCSLSSDADNIKFFVSERVDLYLFHLLYSAVKKEKVQSSPTYNYHFQNIGLKECIFINLQSWGVLQEFLFSPYELHFHVIIRS